MGGDCTGVGSGMTSDTVHPLRDDLTRLGSVVLAPDVGPIVVVWYPVFLAIP